MRDWLRQHPTTQTEFLGMKRPGSPILAVLVLLIFAFGWAGNDVRSCQRSNGIRVAQQTYLSGVRDRSISRAAFESGERRSLDIRAAASASRAVRQVPELDCGLPLPDTK